MTAKNGRASFSSSSAALLAVPYSLTPGESRNFDLTTSTPDVSSGTVADPAYLTSQLKSAEWLQRYGLKSQKLSFDQILQQIGFKRVESFNPLLGKNVSAKYAGNLYHEVQHDNGDRYVLTCRPEKLREYRQRLLKMLNLLRKRLTFITTGSRRLFGILGEPSVCLVCDCKTLDHRIFNQFQSAVTCLIKEQISKIKRFNIIWVTNDAEQFQEQPIDVTPTTVDHVIDWICEKKCARSKLSISSTCEAVIKALKNNVHSVYLLSEGNSSDSAREMLRDNIVKTRLESSVNIPLHVASLFCHDSDTETFLRSLAQSAEGSFCAYKIKNEVADLKAPANLSDPTRIKLQDDKLQFGTNTLSPTPEYPIDVSLMYKEIIHCQNTIDRIEKILGFVRDENQNPAPTFDGTKSLDAFGTGGRNSSVENNFQRSLIVQSSALFNNEETDMASIDWLKSYGLEAQKLDFFSVLQSAAFRHCDGVVTLLKPPADGGKDDKAPADPKDKLINAKYCDQFAHVAWPDGTIRHVHVTPELHRDYERRVRALLEKLKARLLWLKKGSRDVFGTVLEQNIYILIDTSKSMQNHLGFVKDKVRLLIQDQLFAKERVNFVAFNTTINPWRDRLTKISDSSTQSQLLPWIQGLSADGSTNTLAGLRFALADPATEAIYLLTDGRPDQNERHILSQVQYRQMVPVHTIAFNCQDQTANQFLYDLAKQTGGRFHAFNYGFAIPTSIEMPESEDVGFLKEELTRGEKELQRVAALRDECMGRAWSRENGQPRAAKYKSRALDSSVPLILKSQSTLDLTLRPSSSTMPIRANPKKRSSTNLNRKRKSKSATNIFEQPTVINLNPDQWLLPETENFLKGGRRALTENENEPTSDSQRDNAPFEPAKEPSPYDEVKAYLKKNCLVAKHLTIFDVLYPTSVTVKPHYVQIIDRYVLSKVWDDILPLAHGSYVGKLRLINHLAVDLDTYEAELKTLLNAYYQFITKLIWKCLSDEDKQRLAPNVYWLTLTDEQRSQIIREITKEEHTSQTALESFAWRQLTADAQTKLLQQPMPYNDTTKELLKNTLKDADAESTLQGVERMEVEIKRGIKFLQISVDLRKHQTRPGTVPKETPQPTPKLKKRQSMVPSLGQRVICRYNADGFFYPGTIRRGQDGRTMVLFDICFEEEAIGHILLPTNGAIARPNLQINDCVLVRQVSENGEYWAPGVVVVLPAPFAPPPPLYTAQIYTPEMRQVHVPCRDMLKISLALFQRTLLYIQTVGVRNAKPRPSVTVEPPPQPHPDFETIIREQLEPLNAKVEHLHKSQNKRYNKLNLKLDDQSAAIQSLQERSPKPIVKVEFAQASQVPTPPISRPDSRSSTPNPLEPGTTVYALWTDDDALISEGTVRKYIKPNTYIVERADFRDVKSDIPRENLFLKSELLSLKEFENESFALVPYPSDIRKCWCPAVIIRHRRTQPLTNVKFYDCTTKDIDTGTKEVIPITEQQFASFTTLRMAKQNSLVGEIIVGYNDKKKVYMLGTIVERAIDSHEYVIEWCDKERNNQNEEHLFGAFTRRNHHKKGDHVLAMDPNDSIYKFATVTSISSDKQTLTVQFPTLDRRANNTEQVSVKDISVPARTTFQVTEAYYRSMTERPAQ